MEVQRLLGFDVFLQASPIDFNTPATTIGPKARFCDILTLPSFLGSIGGTQVTGLGYLNRYKTAVEVKSGCLGV